MINKSIFFCDIDGTLTSDEADIAEPVIEAAAEFMARGGLLALCTGRAPVGAADVAKIMKVNSPGIVYGGPAIYDFAAGKHLWARPCDSSIHQSIRALCDETRDVSIQAFTQGKIYMYRSNRRVMERCNSRELGATVPAPEALDVPVMKVLLTCDDAQLLSDCVRFFPKDKFNYALASRHFAEATPLGATKRDTAERFAAECGIPLERCFASGDGYTDMPLLKRAGFSYAPQNAPEEIRGCADMTVCSARDGAMAEAFKHATDMMSRF